METPEHDSSPWTYDTHSGRIQTPTDKTIAIVLPSTTEGYQHTLGNGRLLAAAPELLDALNELLEYEDDRPGPGTRGEAVYERAMRAVARATGQAPTTARE